MVMLRCRLERYALRLCRSASLCQPHHIIFFFFLYFALCAKLFQSHLTLCNPLDCAHQAPLSMGFLQLKFLTVTVQAFYLITYLFILQFESLVIYDIVLCCWIRLFVTPWIAAFQASLSSTVSWSLLKFMSVESVMLSNHLILMTLFHHRLL